MGYGASDWVRGVPQYPGAKLYTTVSLARMDDASAEFALKLSGENSESGTCFGDSGGPSYRGADTSIVYGLTSHGASFRCASWGYAVRLDIPEAHAFYKDFD